MTPKPPSAGPSSAFRRASWLTAGAFALHVLEEAPGFTSWARRHASPRYSARDFRRINAAGLAMTFAGTAAVNRSRSRAAYLGYHTLVLTQQALFNPLFHAGTTLAYREYSPGLVTSSTLFWPLWWCTTRAAAGEGRLSRREARVTAALAGLVHAAAVARQVYFVDAHVVRARAARALRAGLTGLLRPM